MTLRGDDGEDAQACSSTSTSGPSAPGEALRGSWRLGQPEPGGEVGERVDEGAGRVPRLELAGSELTGADLDAGEAVALCPQRVGVLR
jgi:hypothetical protein